MLIPLIQSHFQFVKIVAKRDEIYDWPNYLLFQTTTREYIEVFTGRTVQRWHLHFIMIERGRIRTTCDVNNN